MWSVNDRLSRNLWKPPETGRGGFRYVTGSFPNFLLRNTISFSKSFLLIKKIQILAGNRRSRFPEVTYLSE
jgi:hypothetical protein